MPSNEKSISPQQQTWTLVATILGSSLVFINGSTVNVALPTLQRQLNASVADIQWVLNAFLLFLSALILIGGSLGDKLGRRRVYVIGTAIFAGASVWCGLAPNVEQLILARAVQGVGGALLTPGSLALINATFAKNGRGKAIGLWSGFSALTSAMGPLLGGWLIDTFSWRWIFFILVPLAILVIIIALWRVPESLDEQAGDGLDWQGALLATLGLGGVTFGMISVNDLQIASLWIWISIIGGILILLAFFFWEKRVKQPMLPVRLFESRTFAGANALTFLLYAALGAVLFFVPLNLQQVQGYTATETGAAFLPFILLLSILSRWAGGLTSTVGARKLLTIGPIIVAGGFLLLAYPGIGGSYWVTFFPGFFVLGLGMSASVAPLTTTVMSAVAERFSGTASGINNAVSRLASLFAIALFGIIMLQFFGSDLKKRLSETDLNTKKQATLLDRKYDLAEIKIPDTFHSAEKTTADHLIDRSFVFSFRRIMFICAFMAVFSAVLGWLTVDDNVLEEAF